MYIRQALGLIGAGQDDSKSLLRQVVYEADFISTMPKLSLRR